MSEIIKRTRKEWFIFHYNVWLQTLTAKETNLEVVRLQELQVKDIGEYTKATNFLETEIAEAKNYIKVLEKLIKKEK